MVKHQICIKLQTSTIKDHYYLVKHQSFLKHRSFLNKNELDFPFDERYCFNFLNKCARIDSKTQVHNGHMTTTGSTNGSSHLLKLIFDEGLTLKKI